MFGHILQWPRRPLTINTWEKKYGTKVDEGASSKLAPDIPKRLPGAPSSCWSALGGDTEIRSFSPSVSNDFIPSEGEARNIRRDIAEAQMSLSRLAAQIISLDSFLDQLFKEQLRLQKYLDDQKALVSPLRRFPPELLSEIFIWCCPKESAFSVPINVAQVCVRWRAVALATPKLWSSIHLVLRAAEVKAQADAMMVSTWLTRSAESPLILNFTCHNETHPALDAVIPHSQRWQHIYFSCFSQRSLLSLAGVKGRSPLLRSLDITVATGLPLDKDTVIDMFELAPQLRSVRLRDTNTCMRLPWAQLTQLDLQLSAEQCLNLLRDCSALADAKLSLHQPDGYAVTPIRLPHLRSLHVISWLPLDSFFDSLVLPSLREIRVERAGYSSISWTHSHFDSLLSRSSCSLETINFTEILSQGDLIQCVQNIPSLTDLQIKESRGRPCVGNNVLSLLTCGGSEKPLVPKLQFIRLYGPLPFDDLRFVEMVRSRWQGGAGSLRLIQLILQRESDDAILGLKRLRDEGLEVYILAKNNTF